MQNRSPKTWLPLLLSVTLATGMVIGFTMRDNFPGTAFFAGRKSNPIKEVLQLIDERYVDDVASKKWQDSTLNAILNSLDPHSFYITPDEMSKYNESISGKYSGVGISFDIFNDSLYVLQVFPNSPAAKAGIRQGDVIVQANTTRLSGAEFPQDSIGKIIKGPTGSSIQLVVLRDGRRQTYSVIREDVSVNSVDVYYMVNATVGYIAISEFTNHTYRNFMLALTDLQKKGMKSLILDLRGNSGGILDEAIDIADEFIAGDRLITYTEGRKSPRKEYRCKRPGLFESGKLTVLCDEGSASASEVILGALQDWKRATIVGENSFGKGLVQEQYELTNGGGIRLTIARYFTPKGRSIQRPYQHKSIEEYYAQANPDDSAEQKNNTSLFGIQPDLAVSDSSVNTLVFYPTIPSHLSHFALRWAMTHPTLKTTYPSCAAFLSQFKVSSEIWSSLLSFLAGKTPLTDQQYNQERTQIEHQLKVYFALHLWQVPGQRMALNEADPVFQKALETLK